MCFSFLLLNVPLSVNMLFSLHETRHANVHTNIILIIKFIRLLLFTAKIHKNAVNYVFPVSLFTKKGRNNCSDLHVRYIINYLISFAYFANSRSLAALAARAASFCATLAMLVLTKSALFVLAPTIAIK